MDNVFVYNVNGVALSSFENEIEELLTKWLKVENNLDVLVSTFVFDDLGSINIDCVFLTNIDEVNRAKELTELFLDKLNIPYKLEQNIDL